MLDLLLMKLPAYVTNNNLASTVPFALHEKMENNKNTTDTISTLQIQVDDVKNVMTKNIDKVLQREEKLSELVDRTDDLQTALAFPEDHSIIHHQWMCWIAIQFCLTVTTEHLLEICRAD
ncbi:vesicle-associated membrane protein 7 [Alligator mississippiensis]|uniref:vesicle-associated membrane protein 7 n=1 Tax=Alligator mississippiensis TaxID=8496 RepID=UPI002877B2DA|nr:vesicle-associated membrane protein 7 [Alligator mississippiensis]